MATNFIIKAKLGKARSGIYKTSHGEIRTPAFMPVGTRASVKAMLPESVKETGADIILGNTYHLMLRPTAERIAEFGGLHKFMNWPYPILTDSGGFQVMSLSKLRKMSEDGVEFSSHIDGAKYMLTPERSTEIQHLLGSDITMVLDECTPYPISYHKARKSMELSLRWAERSKAAFKPRPGYSQFGIVQGSVYEDLRQKSAEGLINIGFDGYAIGGNMAVCEDQDIMFKVLDYCPDFLPENKPRYLMGVGKPSDIIGAVKRGIDMFDCVIPTRSGRNGLAYVEGGTINIKNAKYANDKEPLEHNCNCRACLNYTKGYLHHLVRVGEILGAVLLTWHNLTYFQRLMSKLRNYIETGKEIDFLS